MSEKNKLIVAPFHLSLTDVYIASSFANKFLDHICFLTVLNQLHQKYF